MKRGLAMLRAIGGARPRPAAVSIPLRDPMGDALTHALVDADLWRSGSTIDLESGDGQVRVRVHLPERSQSSRTFDLEVAHRMRSVIARVLLAEGYGFIFTDALWQEKAGRGWSVVGRARRPQSAQPDADA